MPGEESVVPLAGRRLAEAGASVAATVLALDADKRLSIELALKECAEHARRTVLSEHMGNKTPSPEDCNKEVPGRNVTWAMFLGEEMHRVALKCAGETLSELRPGGFSLEQRYRYDQRTGKIELVSAEEASALLRQWRGGELKGTLVPDVVIHSGNPLQAEIVYDFKFRCTSDGMSTPWSRYPEGHPYQGRSQKQMYQEALRVEAWRIVPWMGVLP